MAEFPALPVWTDAYLADTTHLKTEEHGAYLLMLMAAWRSRECRLPDDDHYLAKVCRCSDRVWRRLRPTLESFWTVEGGWWTQKRLARERKYLDAVRAKRAAAAHVKHKKVKETAAAHAGADAPQPTPTPTEDKSSVLRTGAEAPSTETAKAALWREMKAQIGGKNPGGLIGRWCKDFGQTAVADAHFAAMSNPPADYVSWMSGRLRAMMRGQPAQSFTNKTKGRGSVSDALRMNLNDLDEDDAGEFEAVSSYPVAPSLLC